MRSSSAAAPGPPLRRWFIKNNAQDASGLRPRTAARLMARVFLLIALSLGAASIRSAEAQSGDLQGTVSVSGPDGQTQSLPGASLKLTPATPGRTQLSTVTNELGKYRFTDLAAGLYTMQVGLAGFKQQTRSVTVRPGLTTVEIIQLELAEVSGAVTVVADGEGLNTTEAAPPVTFKEDKLQTLPLVNERFEDTLPLVPGVVRGPDSLLNVKGARASQSGLTVNSANVTDPVTGEFGINLPLEAIQSVEVLTNPYAPEYGEFTGAVTAVQTKSGSDKFDVQVQSISPRPRRRGGAFAGIAAFTPRVTFSGPLVKDKLKFIQSFEITVRWHPGHALDVACVRHEQTPKSHTSVLLFRF